MSYLNDTKLAVAFENIKINADNQLVEGVVRTGYDQLWEAVVLINSWEDVLTVSNEILKIQQEIIEEVERLEQKQVSNLITPQEFQQKIEEQSKKWQVEITKTTKVAGFVSASPAISEKEKQDLQTKTEKKEFSSENLKIQYGNSKKIEETARKVYKQEKENISETKKQLERFTKNEDSCGKWEEKQGNFGKVQIDYIALQRCHHGTIYRLDNNIYIFQTAYNLYASTWTTEPNVERFYIYAEDLKTWVEFVPAKRKFQGNRMPEMMRDILFVAIDFFIPLEDGTVLVTGKNLAGEDKSRLAAAGLFIVNISAGKVVKVVKGTGKVLGKGTKYLGDEAVKLVVKNADKVFVQNLDNVITKLKSKAKYVLEGTGEYATVGRAPPFSQKSL